MERGRREREEGEREEREGGREGEERGSYWLQLGAKGTRNHCTLETVTVRWNGNMVLKRLLNDVVLRDYIDFAATFCTSRVYLYCVILSGRRRYAI